MLAISHRGYETLEKPPLFSVPLQNANRFTTCHTGGDEKKEQFKLTLTAAAWPALSGSAYSSQKGNHQVQAQDALRTLTQKQ